MQLTTLCHYIQQPVAIDSNDTAFSGSITMLLRPLALRRRHLFVVADYAGLQQVNIIQIDKAEQGIEAEPALPLF